MDDLIQRAREALVDVTPGPWRASWESVDPDWAIVTGPGGGIVSNVNDAEQPNARFIAVARDLVPALADRLEAQEALLREAMNWQPIETAPKDGTKILVWYDDDADPYQDPENPERLTAYGTWAEGGRFMDGKGWTIASWFEPIWESTDEYGSGYELPAWWFAQDNGNFEVVVNPTHWMPLTKPEGV